MADNYLERQRDDYDKRKLEWLKKKKLKTVSRGHKVNRQDDKSVSK